MEDDYAGRLRTKASTRRRTTARNFYRRLQIAHTPAQFFERRMGGKTKVTQEVGSLKNLANLLLESLRTQAPPEGTPWDAFMAARIQVRLDTS